MLQEHSFISPGQIAALKLENTNKIANKHPIFITLAVAKTVKGNQFTTNYLV